MVPLDIKIGRIENVGVARSDANISPSYESDGHLADTIRPYYKLRLNTLYVVVFIKCIPYFFLFVFLLLLLILLDKEIVIIEMTIKRNTL